MDSYELIMPKERCDQKVKHSKYEKMKSGMQKFWWNKFKEMDATRAQPYCQKMEYMKECFSQDTLQDILHTGIEVQQDYIQKALAKDDDADFNIKFKSRDKIHSILETKTKRQKYINPYLNFMKKPEDKAQIWRPSPRPSFDQLPLPEKAAILEENIARHFDEWWNGIGTVGKSDIDKDTILDLFQILTKYPVATSVNEDIQQLGVVTADIAKFLGFSQYTKTIRVSRLLQKDISELKRRSPRTIAFNKMLPRELRRQPPSENLEAKWFWSTDEDELASMASAWRGLTELASIRIFCYWLLKHPEVKPPPFLVKEGLLNKDYLDSVSADLVEAGINSNIGVDIKLKLKDTEEKKEILDQFLNEMNEFIDKYSYQI
ncbi:uncharacterized protein CBL_01106 [Carabus blaptoides fortunei]